MTGALPPALNPGLMNEPQSLIVHQQSVQKCGVTSWRAEELSRRDQQNYSFPLTHELKQISPNILVIKATITAEDHKGEQSESSSC